MKETVWKENKERYSELNPLESLGTKVWWTVAAICIGIVALLFVAF